MCRSQWDNFTEYINSSFEDDIILSENQNKKGCFMKIISYLII